MVEGKYRMESTVARVSFAVRSEPFKMHFQRESRAPL